MQTQDVSIPILPSRSLPDTLAFYNRLGFEGKILGECDSYAILTRGTVEIHFFRHPDLRPAESHAGCYVRVADVDTMHGAMAAAGLPGRGIPRLDRVSDKPWGMREFGLVDPDGNLVRIGQITG